ncbi:major facilitator superfamily protein [Lichtheimia corymbifera JMRC:FSU:9682]|uniref:Molybdate-anion transporter n=1 Tax=Lichtheimia corymbifera JMRC:FSU:9682 TaxID=1263082 RepID=A0A068RTC0_9FUNG|nr:major facilitator superfamily protein [Lichtheimia corymbifera JMRC:FSU:9682]
MTLEFFNADASGNEERRLKALQYKYLSVYVIIQGADWLQGPYLYKLYQSYGFELVQIAFLFLTGFVSGALGGTAVGSLADSWGRRRICIVFCATLILSLLLRLGPRYPLLVLSHILSGMAASMQFSVVEAWYVAEHSARGIPADWMSRTFAKATFLNGLVAIIAGIVANAVVDIWGFTAPFILAILLAIGAGVLITSTWSENYGETNSNQARLSRTLMDGLKTLWNDSNILILGAAQTFFECAMYIFVLLYTPAIETAASIHAHRADSVTQGDQEIPFGYLFSTMMFAVMMGSITFQKLEQRGLAWCSKDRLLTLALTLAGGAFTAMVYDNSTSLPILVISYHVFEFTTGMYFPSISSLKAEVIPEETRAAIMTLLRIPMNFGVGVIMWHADRLSTSTMFAICSLMTLSGALLVLFKFKSKQMYQQPPE